MSRLWNRPRLRVYLGEDRLVLRLLAGWPARVRQEAVLPLAPGQSPLAVLEAWWQGVATTAGAGTVRLELVLGMPQVRYLTLPWSADLVDDAVRQALARSLYARQFGAAASPQELRLGRLRFGCPQLAAFVDRDLLDAWRAFALRCGWRLARVEPLLAAVLNAHAPALRGEGPLLVVEPGRRLRVTRAGGAVTAVQVRPGDAGDAAAEAQRLAAAPGLRVFAPLQPALAGWLAGPGVGTAEAGALAFVRTGEGAWRRLALDFGTGRRPGRAVVALVLLALVGVAGALLERSHLLASLEADSASLARGERVLAREATVRAAALPADPRALEQAQALAGALQRPWGEMLDAVQGAARADVVITRLQPASAPGELMVSGQAASARAFLDFVARLQATSRWRQVLPVSQELASADQAAATALPLAFQLRLAGEQP